MIEKIKEKFYNNKTTIKRFKKYCFDYEKVLAEKDNEIKSLKKMLNKDQEYKFYGQFELPVDNFIFNRYFPDTNISGVFIESGAFDGVTDSSCKFFEETMNWTGYNLEPVPSFFEELKVSRPNSNNFQLAFSDKTGTATFNCTIHPDLGEKFNNGSIQHSESHLVELNEKKCTFQKISVNTITYLEFIEKNNITHIDLFVLDVEGHELSVIEGMKGCKILPHIMCIEFGHIGIDKIRDVMDELGYFYDITSYANAFFIRKDVIDLFNFRKNDIIKHPI